MLRDHAGMKAKDLADQIEEVLASGKLPSYIEEGLHAVRNIGNFGAHPLPSSITPMASDCWLTSAMSKTRPRGNCATQKKSSSQPVTSRMLR